MDKFYIYLTCFFTLILSQLTHAQAKRLRAATIAFYNVENLFDTIQSIGYINGSLNPSNPNYHISIPIKDTLNYEYVDFKKRYIHKNLEGKKVLRKLILIEEYTPEGSKIWTHERFNQKISNLAHVISNIGKDVTKNAPVIVGLCEVENRGVIKALINHPTLKPYHYSLVHFNSLDKRGIDNAFIYQKDRFTLIEAKPYTLEVYNNGKRRDYTRDIIRMTGLLDGEKIHFIVNHWPSRRGGEASSNHKRIAAGKLLKSIFDEIRAKDPNAKIIAMGDFNDDPINESIKKLMQTESVKHKVKAGSIYNPMEKMFKKGFGTLAFKDGWNLFDQMLMTGSLVGKSYDSYKQYRTNIFSPSYLVTPEGQYKGYPYRMYGFDTYRSNGYSDHFPIYTILLREVKQPDSLD